jgi:hypothetical protein
VTPDDGNASQPCGGWDSWEFAVADEPLCITCGQVLESTVPMKLVAVAGVPAMACPECYPNFGMGWAKDSDGRWSKPIPLKPIANVVEPSYPRSCPPPT